MGSKKTKGWINRRAGIFLYAVSIGALVSAAVLTAGFFALAFSNADKILYGISAAGENLSRIPPQAAEQILGRKVAKWQSDKIKLKYEDKIWETDPKEMGVLIDWQETIGQAYEIGRNKNILKGAADHISSALFGKNIALEIKIDDKLFENSRARLFGKIEHKATDATLKYSQKTGLFEIEKEKDGYELDEGKLRSDLASSAARLASGDIALKMTKSKPRTVESELIKAQKKANSILSRAPFTLVYFPAPDQESKPQKPQEYKLDKDQLKEIIIFNRKESPDFEADLDETELKNFLIGISPSINRNPENAILTMKDDKVTEFALSKNGVEIDIGRNIEEIRNEILTGDNSVIALETRVAYPEIRTDTIENLGLVSLLAVGESDFKGSSNSRVFNLTFAAKKFNGFMIKPSEEFSFVNAIGEISQKTGYQAGLVIKNGKTVKEYGGGVCQVSTTMFRAAINAGLKITERYPHSLPVQYYNPQGFDATIYGPHPDLRFINDTPSNILVQTRIKGTKLYFEFYGTPDDREVKVIGPVEYDKKPDGSLKTTLTREIYKNGELITTDIFKSSYRSPIKEPVQKNPLE